MAQKFYDLSQPVFANCPCWISHEMVDVKLVENHPAHGDVVERFAMDFHTGTHLDAPYHFCPEGQTIDQIPVENFQGHAVIADLRGQLGPAEPILARHLEPYADRVKEGDILMICTGWGQKRALTKEYCHDWPYISEEAAQWMTAKKLKGVSTDGLSVGGWYEGTGRPAHVELLSHGVWALEETILPDELVEVGECHLFAFPVKFQGFSGAPARAVAVV